MFLRQMHNNIEEPGTLNIPKMLFEIVGRRRNFDKAAPESQQWIPMVAWTKYELRELIEIYSNSEDVDEHEQRQSKETAERMYQQWPEARPPADGCRGEGAGKMDVVNPFLHLMASPAPVPNPWATTARRGNAMFLKEATESSHFE
uniref:Uncharacterized protein n=1 Tax=Leersia perrieri TaxID=77586 RepID=A0A0D9WVB7_9ORYZ